MTLEAGWFRLLNTYQRGSVYSSQSPQIKALGIPGRTVELKNSDAWSAMSELLCHNLRPSGLELALVLRRYRPNGTRLCMHFARSAHQLALNLHIPLNRLLPCLEVLRNQPCRVHRADCNCGPFYEAPGRTPHHDIDCLSPRQHLRINFAAITAEIKSNSSTSEERLDLGHTSTIDSVPLLNC